MLVGFRFKNYRTFRDEAILSMEAVGLASFKNCLIEHGRMKLLPGVVVYGKIKMMKEVEEIDKMLVSGIYIYKLLNTIVNI